MRLISALSFEQSIRIINKRIKSSSNPGKKNIVNEVLNYDQSSNFEWQGVSDRPSIHFVGKFFGDLIEASRIENLLKAYCLKNYINIRISSSSAIKIINTYTIFEQAKFTGR
jgi:hypothetical protein